MFEPVAKKLQAINSNIYGARNQINSLMSVITLHEENAEEVFRTDIFAQVKKISDELQLELRMPQTTFRQRYRTNLKTSNVQEYFRQAIFIPYLDSIQTSLRTRFDDSQFIPGSLLTLHPARALAVSRDGFCEEMERIEMVHKLDSFVLEAITWYDMWKNMNSPKPISPDLTLEELTINHCPFYPAIRHALLIALTLPSTTCTVERSFSTLRRVKTWLRATMAESCTSGFCLMSVHRKKVNSRVEEFINKVIEKFVHKPRRLQFLFSDV